MTQSQYWGYHLILDCANCNDGIKFKDNIYNFTKQLVKDIDMIAYGEPLIEHFATHDPSKGGYSLIQLIETSNISGHFVDATNECYIDVFSCKPFNEEDVINCVKKYFGAKNINKNMIYRKAY